MEPPDGIGYTNYMSVLKPFFAGSSGPEPTPTTTTTGSTPTGGDDGGEKAQHWGQCGGNGWTGPTQCISPYTCQKLNDWYSQCL